MTLLSFQALSLECKRALSDNTSDTYEIFLLTMQKGGHVLNERKIAGNGIQTHDLPTRIFLHYCRTNVTI